MQKSLRLVFGPRRTLSRLRQNTSPMRNVWWFSEACLWFWRGADRTRQKGNCAPFHSLPLTNKYKWRATTDPLLLLIKPSRYQENLLYLCFSMKQKCRFNTEKVQINPRGFVIWADFEHGVTNIQGYIVKMVKSLQLQLDRQHRKNTSGLTKATELSSSWIGLSLNGRVPWVRRFFLDVSRWAVWVESCRTAVSFRALEFKTKTRTPRFHIVRSAVHVAKQKFLLDQLV